MIFSAFEVLTSFIEIYLIYCVIELLMSKEDTYKYKIISSIGLTIIIITINNMELFSIIPLFAFPLYISLTASRIYACKIYYVLSISMFYALLIYLIDFGTVSVISIIIGDSEFPNTAFTQISIERLVFICIAKLELVCLFFILRRFIGKIKKLEYYNSILIISAIGFMGASFLIGQTLEAFNISMAVSWIFLTIIIVLLIIILAFNTKYKYEKSVIEFTEMRNEVLEKNYLNIRKLYEDNSKQFHDFNNHIKVMRRLANKKDYDKLSEYIKNFNIIADDNSKISWTDDSVVDFILNSKIDEGKKAGISFTINAEFPQNTNIKSNDITTILANLLDNAIEACNRADDSKDKWVNVTIRTINSMILIKIKNSCFEAPKKSDTHLLTHKRDKKIHGWGLMSVEVVVKKYGGSMICDFKNNIFTTVVNLSFTKIDPRM